MLPTEAIGELLSTNNIKKSFQTIFPDFGKFTNRMERPTQKTTDKPGDNFSVRINRNTDPKLVSKLNCKTF